jgi:hypothetical protein
MYDNNIVSDNVQLCLVSNWKHVLSFNVYLTPGLFRIYHIDVDPTQLEFVDGLTPGSRLAPESVINDLVYTEPVKIYLSDVYYQLSEEKIIIRCTVVPEKETIVKSELIVIGNEIINELIDSGFTTESGTPYFY